MKADAKQTVNRPVSRSLKQLEPESDTYIRSLTPIPATARSYAAEQVRQLDQLALIGYPPLDPATRAVYEVTLRLGAEKLLDGVGR